MTRRVNKAYAVVFGEKGPVEGMKYCLQGRFISSTLALCYSLIDMMAWLSLPEGRDEVHAKDFIGWANRYVIPDAGLECTAEDLYAARCGVVHCMTPESRMSKSGKATKMVYSWANKKPYSREKVGKLGVTSLMIHVDTLCEAVERGARKFLIDVRDDKKQLKATNLRALKLLKEDRRLPSEIP